MRRLPLYILIVLLLSHCSTQKEAMNENSAPSSTDTLSSETILNAQEQYIKGIKEFELENYEAALDRLTEAYVKMPDKAGVNYALADAYLQLDDLPNAAHYGKKAANLDPANKWYHLKLYEIYRKAGKNQATIQELERILKYHPDDTDILERLAQTYNDYGEPLKAINVYNKILSRHGPDLRIHLKKFRNFQKLNMRDSTLRELQRIRELDPDNITTLHTLSEFYLDNDQPQEARETLREALDRNPRNPQSLIMMAEAHMMQNRWDSAGSMMKNIIADTLVPAHGKMEVAQYLYSKFKSQSSNTQLREQTEQVLTQLIETEPQLGRAHALVADFYLETQQHTKALEQLEKTLEINPNNTAVWRERIRLLYIQQNHDQIIELAEKADEHAPQDPFITFFIGSSHLISQNHNKAVEWLSESSSLPAKKSFKSIVFGSLADAYSSLDNWDQADRAYQKALDLDSTNHNAMNNFAYYLSKREERLEYAKKLALKALELLPGNASYLDTAGWVFYKLGEYEKARDYIEKAAQSDNASAVVYEHLGDVYKKLGELEKAHTWWENAYQKDSSRTYLKKKIKNNPIQ